jgi:hypothetical protein
MSEAELNPVEIVPSEAEVSLEDNQESEVLQGEPLTEETSGSVKEEPGKPTDYSPQEKKEIEAFMGKLNLPKEVTYFQDESGALKFIVPINGHKYVASPEEVFKGFNLNQAGYQKLNEAKQLIKNTEEYFAAIKGNPKGLWDLADKLGVNKYELAQSLLEEKIRDAEMTPAERALKQKEAEAAEYKARLEKYEKEQEDQKMAQQVSVEREKYDKELVEAMQKHGFNKLSSNGKSTVLASAVNKLMLALQSNHELSVSDAIYLAKQEWKESVPAVFDEIPDHLLLESLPPKFVERIQKAILERHQKSGKVIPTATANEPVSDQITTLKDLGPTSPKKVQKRKSLNEFFESL